MLYDFTYTWNTNKKTKYVVRENILVLARGERSEIGEGSPVKKSINQGDVMYSMATTVNNIV